MWNLYLTCVFSPLRALLLGLACNHNLKGVSLDLSNCEVRTHLDYGMEEIIIPSKLLCLFPGKSVRLNLEGSEKHTFYRCL